MALQGTTQPISQRQAPVVEDNGVPCIQFLVTACRNNRSSQLIASILISHCQMPFVKANG